MPAIITQSRLRDALRARTLSDGLLEDIVRDKDNGAPIEPGPLSIDDILPPAPRKRPLSQYQDKLRVMDGAGRWDLYPGIARREVVRRIGLAWRVVLRRSRA